MAGKGGKRKLGRNLKKCQMYRSLGKREENKRRKRVSLLARLARKLNRMRRQGRDISFLERHIENLM